MLRLPATYSDIFSFGAIHIRIYGLAFVLVYFLLFLWLKRRQPALNREAKRTIEVADLLLFITAGMIIGARLGFILAVLSEGGIGPYLEKPISLIAVWEGGLSFHGGLLGGGLVVMAYAKRVGANALSVLDNIVPVLPLGMVLVRISNFLAGELLGRQTDGALAVSYPSDPVFRHPSQLYEAAGALLVLVVIFSLSKKLARKPGALTLVYILATSLVRFIVDFYREPSRLYLGLTLAQIISLALLFGAALIFLSQERKKIFASFRLLVLKGKRIFK